MSDSDVPLAVAAKKRVVLESDSDSDAPLAARKPAAAKAPTAKKAPAAKKEVAEKQTIPKKRGAVRGDGPVREKKVYDLPGQTRETPGENDSLRRFYTSLLEQRPSSEMAMKWCVQHGLLPRDKAQAWVDSQKKGAGRSPAKAAPKAAAKRKAAAASDADDEGEAKPQPKKRKPAAAAAAKEKPAAAAKAKPKAPLIPRKQQAAKQENEEGEWSDEEGEVMPAKKQRQPPAANGAAAAKPPLIPRKQPHVPATKKDVAFDAVAMEDDSDDDVPLAQRGR